MSLRRQLLLVSLLLLSLPWAGCQFVREMESALRYGQEQSLQATAQAVAAVLKDKPGLLYPNTDRLSAPVEDDVSLYAIPRSEPVIVDGYADGWDEPPPYRFVSDQNTAPLAVSYRAITRAGRLYLLLEVEDPQVIYHNPGLSPEPNGDRLLLRTWRNNRRQDYVIATAAPGSVTARYASPVEPGAIAGRIRGQWQDSELGYTLELAMPLSVTGGRLGFYIVNASGKAGEQFETLGNITPLDMAAPPWLIYTSDALLDTIAPFDISGRELDVIEKGHWLLAPGTALAAPSAAKKADGANGDTFWVLRLLYRSILSQSPLEARASPSEYGKSSAVEVVSALGGSPDNQRYRDPDFTTRSTLSATAPVFDGDEVVGAVLMRQSSEEYLSLTDRAFSRLLGYSLAALCTGIFGLLGFASILSWRIRTLGKAAREVALEDGVALDNFPRSRMPDEIGELSRNYADLLQKLREYNDYLRTLSRKLSHELQTPIAVIQTSLENLEQHRDHNGSDGVYLERARGGLARLGKILNAMSEASSLEESIRGNKKQALDLLPLLREVFAAYQTVYPHHKLISDYQVTTAMTIASPELLVQALDKFMDNAASFCPPGGTITLRLSDAGDRWCMAIMNEGPLLPDKMQGQLFNSMVSVRQKDSEDIHLGLGLHIAHLIAEFHGANVEIRNLEDRSGVSCSIALQKNTD